jgi:hypothetical protein
MNLLNVFLVIENFTAAQEKKYLEWFGTFELTGIPQVVIPNHLDPTYGVAKRVRDNINDDSDLNNQMATASETPVDQTIVAATAAIGDYQESGAPQPYFNSIASTTKLQNSNIKKVFSEDQFNCCVPTGIEVPEGTTSEQCCTGYIANIGGPLRCCLPDFTDVSVYLNRYVSSEGRGLSDSAYDPKTGYIKDPATVLQKAANVCCSGKAAYGVAISTLHIPLTDGTVDESAPKTRRFVYRDDSVDNNAATNSIGSRFEAGLKWNNHVYCVPTTYNAE